MNKLSTLFWRVLLLVASNPVQIAEIWRRLGVEVGSGTCIYRNVRLGRGGKDPISIGKECVLTGCTILGHDASTNRYLGLQHSMMAPVVVEDECFIGHGAIVLMGVTIGKGSIVGAGAVVTKDVSAGSVVAGNPARVVTSVADLVARRKQLIQTYPELFFDHLRQA